MAWERIPDTEGEFSGDEVWDVFAEALTKIARIYEGRFGRRPTVRELQRGLDFVLHGAPARFVVDLEPSRRLAFDDFEAASGDMEGDVEPAFVSRRANGEDVLRLWLVRDGRTLLCRYEILDTDLSDQDARGLFVACYLKALTGDAYADDIDVVRFSRADRPDEVVEMAYPR